LVDASRPEKIRWHRFKASLTIFDKQRHCKDSRLLYTVWFSENINFAEPQPIKQQATDLCFRSASVYMVERNQETKI